MEIGMEQLIWVIIFIIFIVATFLKSRANKRSKATTERTPEAELKGETLSRYLEEILGVEISETKPQIAVEKEKPKPLKKSFEPKIKSEKEVGEFLSPLIERAKKDMEHLPPKKKDIYRAKFPWSTISKKDLPTAIIFSEIVGPPIAKRKTHRLF